MPLCCSSVLRIVKGLSVNTFLLCVTPSASIPMCDCSDPHLNSYERIIDSGVSVLRSDKKEFTRVLLIRYDKAISFSI
jgi:hypothetical protein